MKSAPAFSSFYKGKKVFVTGHAGFKGAWLTLWLHEMGAKVTGFGLAPGTQPSFFQQCKLADKIDSRIGDVRDLGALKVAIEDVQPEIVFHLAAQPLVRYSYKVPVQTFSTNVLGTVHLLEAVKDEGPSVKVCQVITSDKCYENRETGDPYRESDPMGGHDPYSASKGAAELVVASYRKSFFQKGAADYHPVSLASVRAGNVFGGGDWSLDRIIPDCVRALSKVETIPVRNPAAIRPWQYVLDALGGYLLLAAKQASGDEAFASAWNFGPDKSSEKSVQELVETMIKSWGEGKWETPKSSKPVHEAKLLHLDCSKSRDKLGWRPVLSFEEAIGDTIQWYKNAKEGTDNYGLAKELIEHYVTKGTENKCPWIQPQKTKVS